MAKAYDPYADVLYGAPINQPAQVVNKSGNAVPGAEYNDHEQQKLEREKAETPYLMTKFWRKVRSMEMGTTKDLGR